MASLVISAKMQLKNDLDTLFTIAEDIFELASWAHPDMTYMSDMTQLLSNMDTMMTNMLATAPQTKPGKWVAVNVRAPSVVIFYYVTDGFDVINSYY